MHELFRRHLQGEQGYGLIILEGRVAGNGKHEGGFTHTGTTSDNDEIGFLPTAGFFIYGAQSTGNALEVIGILPDRFQIFDGAAHHLMQRLAVALEIVLYNIKYLFLCLIQQIQHIV